MNDSNVNSMFLNGVNRKEILDVIKSFDNKTSTDYNGLNMFILKKITNFIVEPFLHICNLSLSKGVFLDAMKIARVIPLFKSGYKHILIIIDLCHFYPKFLRFSKNYLIIDKNCKCNCKCQYGFRNSRSTYMALLDLVENINIM